MVKKLIRLTESDLHRIVKESVNKIINEYFFVTPNDEGLFDSDYDMLSDTDNEDEYYDTLNWMKDRQRAHGDNAMDYHPQRNRSTIMGDDFASSYAKDPSFNNNDAIDNETERARWKYGLN